MIASLRTTILKKFSAPNVCENVEKLRENVENFAKFSFLLEIPRFFVAVYHGCQQWVNYDHADYFFFFNPR